MTRDVVGCECAIEARGATIERDTQYVKRDLSVYMKRDLCIEKEPRYVYNERCSRLQVCDQSARRSCQKRRPICQKRPINENYVFEKRPVYLKKDLCV